MRLTGFYGTDPVRTVYGSKPVGIKSFPVPYALRETRMGIGIRMREQRQKLFLASLTGAMQLPEDFVRGNILVQMQGREHMTVENFKGISSYTTEEVRLLTRRNRICIFGKNLRIDCYTKEEIEISGRIDRLEYQ